jgi:hypothetical protein
LPDSSVQLAQALFESVLVRRIVAAGTGVPSGVRTWPVVLAAAAGADSETDVFCCSCADGLEVWATDAVDSARKDARISANFSPGLSISATVSRSGFSNNLT